MMLRIPVNLDKVALKECKRCKSTMSPIDSHHVTYHPERRVHLCRPCHYGVTIANTWYSGLVCDRLDTHDRLVIHRWFMRIKWRMADEKKPIKNLRRSRIVDYSKLLPELRKRFVRRFGDGAF